MQAIAISSYQGGHVEFFKYMIDLLRQRGAQHIKVFGGGGGVIIAQEIADLEAYGVAKIYSPEDGRRMGLQGMIDHMLSLADFNARRVAEPIDPQALRAAEPAAIARAITAAELDGPQVLPFPCPRQHDKPVIGITGTGGAGKSSLTDELIRRLRLDQPSLRVAILSVDPSPPQRRRAPGRPHPHERDPRRPRLYALAGDARQPQRAVGRHPRRHRHRQTAGYDLTIVETSGIGQGDAAITEVADLTLYVMTSEFGASTQLEKIDMLDFADSVAINKFERRGAPMRCAISASSGAATTRLTSPCLTRRCLSSPPSPAASTMTASTPSTSPCSTRSTAAGPRGAPRPRRASYPRTPLGSAPTSPR